MITENMQQSNINTLKALKWSTLGNILPQIISPFIAIFIARLLDPKAFGLIAVAMIVISFLNIFLTTGFTTALIQKQGTKEEVFRTADFIFCFNMVLSVFIYVFVFLSSSFLANFFKSPESKVVIQILSLNLIIQALGAVHYALLQKYLDFKSLFWIQIAPLTAQVVITLPLAWLGFGVWALVFGQLISSLLSVVILWVKSCWKPKWNFDYSQNREIINFGLIVISTTFFAWLLNMGDNFIVGKFLSIKELGLYSTAFNFDSRIVAFFISPIIPVFFARFCAFKTENELKEYYIKTKKFISIIVFPAIIFIILFSWDFERFALGKKWIGIGIIMCFLSVTGISNLWALLGELYKAVGNPKVPLKITFIVSIVNIPLWLFFIQFGLYNFLIARVFTASIAISINTYYENKILKQKFTTILKTYMPSFIAAIFMFISGISLQKYIFAGNYSFVVSLLIMLISLSVYYLTIKKLASEEIQYILNIIFETLKLKKLFPKIFPNKVS